MNPKIKKEIKDNLCYQQLKNSFKITSNNIAGKGEHENTYAYNYGFLKSAVTLFIEEVESKSATSKTKKPKKVKTKNSIPSCHFEPEDRCANCGSPCDVERDVDEFDFCNDCRPENIKLVKT